jgi:hypothetical protein
MSLDKPSFGAKLINRIFPPSIDFFGLLNQQIGIVADMAEIMVDYMESQSDALADKLIEKEAEADVLKDSIMVQLNEAFSTPVDREDIHRAVVGNEDLANYLKATIREFTAFELIPNIHDFDIAVRLRDGIHALKSGFALLASKPMDAVPFCDEARKFERKVEKIYRVALSELFEKNDFNYIFKRREVYRHLSNAADRLTSCATTLNDIIVKSS